ncbi:hypothetical protein DMH01_02875 [Amycolatopsis sp. WAC 04182]|nr:hypothetical protein DMH01_02875 [Amycolatopsis sp. WAC 04182]
MLARLIHDGFPPKVALAKLYRMADQDYIEYGSSPAFAWPTEKGRAFLAAEAANAPRIIREAKRCPSCRVEKPVAEFGRNAARPDGLQSVCRACRR